MSVRSSGLARGGRVVVMGYAAGTETIMVSPTWCGR
jgi:hypothetical protein